MFNKAAERIRSIPFNQILDEILDDQRFFILDLIRSQLIKGERADGTDIGHYSSSDISIAYVETKNELGIKTDLAYNLLGLNDAWTSVSGDFFRSLVITIKKEFVEIESLDPKLPSIEALKGMTKPSLDDALELNPENLQSLIDNIKPLIQQKVDDYLRI